MTRIIAGAAQRTNLKIPASGTRPTSDKVREAIFSTLQARGALVEAEVLDLYAGSGALGLEALSRGCLSVDLVDLANPAILALRANLANVQKAIQKSTGQSRLPRGQVSKQNVLTYLQQWQEAKAQGVTVPGWHLVFLDPPYDLENETLLEVLAQLHPLIDPDAWVVIERSTRSLPLSADRGKWEVVLEKTYGETWVGYWRPAIVDSAEQEETK